MSAHSFWEDWQHKIDRDNFRGESHYLAQLAGATEAQYRTQYEHCKKIRPEWLEYMIEDGAFGALTFDFDGRVVSRDLLDSILELDFLERNLGMSSKKRRIVDIGAGYGRMAHRIREVFDQHRIWCCDAVPVSKDVCWQYLGHRGVKNIVVVTPGCEADVLPDLDLALNIHSWSECTLEEIKRWLELLGSKNTRMLFLVPHDERFLTMEKDGKQKSFRQALGDFGWSLKHSEPKPEGCAFPTTYYLFQRGQ